MLYQTHTMLNYAELLDLWEFPVDSPGEELWSHAWGLGDLRVSRLVAASESLTFWGFRVGAYFHVRSI